MATTTSANTLTNPLPREIAPATFWLGDCLHFPYDYNGHEMHGYHSVFLLAGEERSMIIEGGHPRDLPVIEAQLDSLLATGISEPEYLFITHTEMPHCGGVGRCLAHFPKLTAVGDVSDLHLVFPEFEGRFRPMSRGESLDLGGTQFAVVEAVFRDYIYTRWGFDTRNRTLFTGDGFAYSHYHMAGQCGQVAEEVSDLDIPGMTSQFAELAFAWTRYVDIEPYTERLDSLLFDELGVNVIAPSHGLPITDPRATMPSIRDGLRVGSQTRAADFGRD